MQQFENIVKQMIKRMVNEKMNGMTVINTKKN